MSILFLDRDFDVVRLRVNRKDGSGFLQYNFAEEFFEQGGLYSGSPTIHPLLVEPPTSQRGVGTTAAIRYSPEVRLYGKAHFTQYGQTIMDLMDLYEFHDGIVEIFYIAKPTDAVGAFSTADNTRQTLRVRELRLDQRGILSLACEDSWLKDREVTKKLQAADARTTFPDMDEASDGEYGATVFGESTVADDGVMLNAPYIESQIDGSNRPTAKLFSGWTFPNQPNQAFKRLMARHEVREGDLPDYVPVFLDADPQSAIFGNSTLSSPIESDLSQEWRGMVVTAADLGGALTGAVIITNVRCYLKRNEFERCADIPDAGHLMPDNREMFSVGDEDFTFEVWVYFDALHDGSNKRHIIQQGKTGGKLEWALYFGTADDKLIFATSSDGSSYDTTVTWGTAASTATWYQVFCWHNATADTIGISVNDGTPVTASNAGKSPVKRNAKMFIGGQGTPSFDGRMRCFRFWEKVVSAADRTALYNSGTGLFDEDTAFTDAIKDELRATWPMNELRGPREAGEGSTKLLGRGTSPTGWAVSNKAVTFTSDSGELSLVIYEATAEGGGVSYATGTAIRKSTYDVSQITSGGSASCDFQIDPPFVMVGPQKYLFGLEWSNTNNNRYFVITHYKYPTSSTFLGCKFDQREKEKEKQWKLDVSGVEESQVAMEFHIVGYGDDAWKDGITTTPDRYSYLHLEAKSVNATGEMTQKEFVQDLDLKIGVFGVEDDGSGTYTGSASATIKNPSDLIRFTLMNIYWGLGLTSSDVETSTLDAVRTYCSTNGLNMAGAVNSQTTAEDFILRVCRQARLRFYKTRVGKLALNWPLPVDTHDFYFSEPLHRDDMIVTSVEDNPFDTVVNKFLTVYGPDILNLSKDPLLIRKAETDKYIGVRYVYEDTSSDNDIYRQGLCAASQALYGLREFREAFDFYDTSAPVTKVQNYYIDRYSRLAKRFKIKVPRKKYYTSIDLFSKVRVAHTYLQFTGGDSQLSKCHDSQYTAIAYDEGVPSVVWSGGSLLGEVVEIAENSYWMEITCETVNPF